MCYRHSLAENSENNDYVPYNTTSSCNEKITKLAEKIKCVHKSFGTGYHHKIEIGTSLSDEATNKEKDVKDKDHKLVSLEFANMCVKNALNLLPSNQHMFGGGQRGVKPKPKFGQNESFDEETPNPDAAETTSEPENDPSPNKQKSKLDKKVFNCVWPSKPIGLAEVQSLRSSILVAAAFITLCLRDYISCIKYCNILLDKEEQINLRCPISKGHR